MVVRNGLSKKTGAVYSIAYRLGETKEKYQYLDEKDTYFTDDVRAVGTLLKVEQMEVGQK
jgi:hypothetical protein